MNIKFPDFIWSNFSYIDMFTSRTHGDVMWLFKSLQDESNKTYSSMILLRNTLLQSENSALFQRSFGVSSKFSTYDITKLHFAQLL